MTKIFIANWVLILCVTLITGCGGRKNHNQYPNKQNALCYRNEYIYQDNPDKKDVLELMLSLDSLKVTGSYNWLPAEKDKRTGTLKGVLENQVIRALYSFAQEGISDTTTIRILLKDNKAIITGGRPELGLNATIEQSDCN